jgi:hypothetical protein
MIEKDRSQSGARIQPAATAHFWMCYDSSRNWLFILEKTKKEAHKIKATVMSLLFRSRSLRKLPRTSSSKSHRETHAPTFDLGAVLSPGPRAVPVQIAPTPRRRRAHTAYTPGRPRHAMFRVT